MSPIFTHYFTPKEANRRLPLIRQIVAEILTHGRDLKAELLAVPEGGDIPEQCLVIKEKIEDLMNELEQLGCFFKDWNFEIGMVDFPAMVEGKEVLLCWRSDEPEVGHYHGVDEGYAGRKTIPDNEYFK